MAKRLPRVFHLILLALLLALSAACGGRSSASVKFRIPSSHFAADRGASTMLQCDGVGMTSLDGFPSSLADHSQRRNVEAKIATSNDSVLLTAPLVKLPAGYTLEPGPGSSLTLKTPVTNPGGPGTDFTIVESDDKHLIATLTNTGGTAHPIDTLVISKKNGLAIWTTTFSYGEDMSGVPSTQSIYLRCR
jgi:hypothetical protein